MSEVGVDPELVARSATALAHLRDTLAANVPTIVNTMSQYGAGVNTAVLKQAQSQSVDDATQMQTRARLAQLWEVQGVSLTGGLLDIPWDGSALDTADAQAEAKALAAAEAEATSNPKAAAASIQAIQADLSNHLTDTTWLASFYNAAGPSVAKLATTLHDIDPDSQSFTNRFTVLSKADQQTMATFGQGLAITDKAGKLSAQTVQAIADAPGIWSASMLIKFGPPGSSWATSEPKSAQNPDGLSLLAVMTDNVYKDEQDGTIKIPLGGKYDRYGAPDQTQLTETLDDYDPLAVMLTADAQNKNAAWQVMGDTNPVYGNLGAPLAKMLLWNDGDLPSLDARFYRGGPHSDGTYPDYFTMSAPNKAVPDFSSSITLSFLPPSIAGDFLNAATSAPRGTDVNAEYAAQAALTIIQNTPSPDGDSGVQLDPAIQQALTATAQRYLLDLAMSTTNGGPTLQQPLKPGAQLPVWSLDLNGDGKDSQLATFLQQAFYNNTSDVAALNAAAKVTFGNIYAQQQLNTAPAWLKNSGADTAMAGLLGSISTAANADNIDVATDIDEQHEEYNQMIQLAEDTVKFIPVVGETADTAMDPTLDTLALLGVPTTFSTDNAANAQAVGSENFALGATQLHIPLIQGLINNGAPGLLASAEQASSQFPPADQFLKNGKIVLSNPGATSAFNSWYEGQVAGKYGPLKDLAAIYGSIYTGQGAVESGQGPW